MPYLYFFIVELKMNNSVFMCFCGKILGQTGTSDHVPKMF